MRHNKEIVNHAIDGLVNLNEGVNACDIHHELFNTDYFIIGYYQSEEFLKRSEDGIFGAIEIIREYEQSNFGEVNTDFSSSEKVANMYAYIKGEEILNDCPTIQKKWNEDLTKRDLKKIEKELNALL